MTDGADPRTPGTRRTRGRSPSTGTPRTGRSRDGGAGRAPGRRDTPPHPRDDVDDDLATTMGESGATDGADAGDGAAGGTTAAGGSSSVMRNTAVMAAGTVVSRLTGMVRDIVLVAAIGTGVFSDTYSVGNTLPNVIYILLVGGALNAVFIPQLVRHMRDDDDDGDGYADRLLTLTGLILLAVSALAVLLAPLIVRVYGSSDWSASDVSTATAFARYCLPQIFFYGVFALLSQVLNARGRFAAPMFAPILNNVVVIATAILFIAMVGGRPTTATITPAQTAVLGIGTTLGIAVQAAILVPVLRRTGYLFRARFDFRGHGLGKAGTLAKWTIGFVLVNQLTYLLITNLATTANVLAQDQDAIAAGLTSYQKAHLLFILPHSIITVSIVTALLPRMSRAAHDGRLRDVAGDVSYGVRVVGAVLIPAAAVLVVLGTQIGILLYAYGASSRADASYIGVILAFFALGLPAFSLYYVLLRGFYALEDTRTPFYVNLVLNVLNAVLAFGLFAVVGVSSKVPMLALGYSLAYWFTLVVCWRVLALRLGGLQSGRAVRSLVRMTIAAVVSGGVTFGTLGLLLRAGTADRGVLGVIVNLAVCGTVFLACYLAMAWSLRIDEVDDVRRMVTGRFSRAR